MSAHLGSAGGLAALLLGALLAASAGAGDPLLSVSPRDAILRQIDSADGSTLDASVTITLPGFTVTGATGLARHPSTGLLYALLKVQGRTFRELVILDEVTGIATSIGNTTDKFAGITFVDDTLYGVSGDGGAVPESLYILDTSDASATLVLQLGAGSDGEVIAFNPDDGLIYHASGIGTPNQSSNGEIFETIDPDTLAVTNVPLSGYDYQELTALAVSSDGGFHAADVGDALVDMPHFLHLTTGGAVTFLGDMDHVAKGFVPVPEPGGWLLLPSGLALVGFLVRLRERRHSSAGRS